MRGKRGVWGKGRTEECPWTVERKERGRWLVVAGFEPPPGCLVPPPPKSFPQIPPPRLPATRRVIPPAWHAEPLARRTEGTGLAWKAVAGWDLDHKSRLDTVPLSLWSDVAAVSMAVKRGLCAATQAFLQLLAAAEAVRLAVSSLPVAAANMHLWMSNFPAPQPAD